MSFKWSWIVYVVLESLVIFATFLPSTQQFSIPERFLMQREDLVFPHFENGWGSEEVACKTGGGVWKSFRRAWPRSAIERWHILVSWNLVNFLLHVMISDWLIILILKGSLGWCNCGCCKKYWRSASAPTSRTARGGFLIIGTQQKRKTKIGNRKIVSVAGKPALSQQNPHPSIPAAFGHSSPWKATRCCSKV